MRCAYAAGDIRAHGELLLEELPEDLSQGIGVFLYNDFEVASLRFAIESVYDFFEGGHWFGSLIPKPEDPVWARLVATCESAKQALIANGMPPYNEDLTYRDR